MNRVICLYISLMLAAYVHAQTQQGYVKTLGRPDKKGVALSGVTVRLKDVHNAVVSRNDGTFAVKMPGKKLGEAYALQQVQKQGYELNEKGVIGRQYAFSDKVPLTIVMVSSAQLQADKQRIENTAYQVAERNYKARLASLEKQLSDSAITIEKYREQLQDLQDKFEKYQQLIDGLAEHYAHTDYDLLDEKDREINLCIERGDLDRTDSLIHTLFDPVGVLQRNKEALSRIDSQISQAQGIIAQANEDMAAVLKQQEKDAEYLYQLHTIALARYDNEKAALYIETRAELDTTNAKWQFDAAKYSQEQNQFRQSETYYVRALRLNRQLAAANPQTYEPKIAATLNNLALLYSDIQRFTESEMMHQEALEIRRRLASANPQAYEPDLTMTLNNLAGLYSDTQRFAESEKMYQEALEIRRRLASANPQAYEPEVATTLNNLGLLYSDTQRFADSEKMYQEALEIHRKLAAANPQAYEPDVAWTLNGLAGLYSQTQRFADSEKMYQEALEIRRKLAAVNPQAYELDLALTLQNLATLYKDTQQFTESEKIYKEAFDIYHRLAEVNPQAYEPYVALTLRKLANLYSDTQRFEESEKMLQEALNIYRRLVATNPQAYEPDMALMLNILALLYSDAQRFAESEKMYQEALEIYRRIAVANPQAYEPNVALTCYCLGLLKKDMEQSADAIPYFQEAMELYRHHAQVNPTLQQWYENSLERLSLLYPATNNYTAAYQINEQWLPILKKRYEENKDELSSYYAGSLGSQSFCASCMKKFAEAEQYAREGLAIDSTLDWINGHLAAALLFQGKYAEAEKIYRQYKDELKDSFLDDFKQFAEAGVIPKEREADVERIKKILNE